MKRFGIDFTAIGEKSTVGNAHRKQNEKRRVKDRDKTEAFAWSDEKEVLEYS